MTLDNRATPTLLAHLRRLKKAMTLTGPGTWQPMLTAYWNPGERDLDIIVEAIWRAMAGRYTNGVPVGVMGLSETGDLHRRGLFTRLEALGLVCYDGVDAPDGHKESYVVNPIMFDGGTYKTTFLHAAFMGLRTATGKKRRRFANKYLHELAGTDLLTGRTPTYWLTHLWPSPRLNTGPVRTFLSRLRARAVALSTTGTTIGMWDANLEVDTSMYSMIASMVEYESSQEAWPTKTFVADYGKGRAIAIDHFEFTRSAGYQPLGTLAVDVDGVERGKGGEHYLMILVAQSKTKRNWTVPARTAHALRIES